MTPSRPGVLPSHKYLLLQQHLQHLLLLGGVAVEVGA